MLHIALFGIHKLLIDTLTALHRGNLLPEIVVFPQIVSTYHQAVVDFCEKHKIRFFRPSSVNDPSFLTEIKDLSVHRIVVTGYNEIFGKELISIGSDGIINCHGGLLPEERGPVPYKWAIYDNRDCTGVTYHRMTEKLDKGKIYIKNVIKISDSDTNQDLFEKICVDISTTVPLFFTHPNLNDLANSPEDESLKGTYKGQIPSDLTRFDLSLPYSELSRRVRAFSPRPGVVLKLDDKTILVKRISRNLEEATEQSIFLNALDGQFVITDFDIVQ